MSEYCFPMAPGFVDGFVKQATRYGMTTIQSQQICRDFVKMANEPDPQKHSTLTKLLSAVLMGTGGAVLGQGLGAALHDKPFSETNSGTGFGALFGAYSGYRDSEKIFPKQQIKKSATYSDSLNDMISTLYPSHKESIFDVADQTAMHNADSTHKTRDEIVAMLTHGLRNSVAPSLAGAAAGGAGAYASAKSSDNLVKRVGKGALLGGGLGFGSGMLNDAYHLGDNTRDQIIQSIDTEKRTSHDPEKLDNNISELKKAKWYEFFSPDRIDDKLK